MAKTGIILCNIGTPKSYNVTDVKEYLLKFLMDEDIISIPYLARWSLVHGIIVPRRAAASAENYKKIWMTEGSPLWVYTKHFAEQLQNELGNQYVIKIGMRYSEPSIETALKQMAAEKVQSILLVPLFPQYAEATTGSVMKEYKRVQEHTKIKIPTQTLKHFYADKGFVETTAELAQETLQGKLVDHYLFSFHGLPESHVRRNKTCLKNQNCCFERNSCEKPCYRAQCFASAQAIAQKMGLNKDQWTVSFQSRVGRGEWLKPATNETITSLATAGKKNLAVLCPSFVADCIETLEEIAIGGFETFMHAGGENYYLVPCLNQDPRWVQKFAKSLKNFQGQSSHTETLAEI